MKPPKVSQSEIIALISWQMTAFCEKPDAFPEDMHQVSEKYLQIMLNEMTRKPNIIVGWDNQMGLFKQSETTC